jgi:PleD family two-component response regulator
MMPNLPIHKILRDLFGRLGAFPVVVFDVDEFSDYSTASGAASASDALSRLAALLTTRATDSDGRIHFFEPDRFLIALPTLTYDEAVIWAERCVDAVRELAIPFRLNRSPSVVHLTVTAATILVGSSIDIEKFQPHVDELLRDGKSNGGDTIVRDR